MMLKLKLQHLGPWCEELAHWKRPWCWERLRAGGEGDNRGWDGWMASLTQWTWVWVNSRSWWWTGRPGVLQSMGSQRAGHNFVTGLNWTEYITSHSRSYHYSCTPSIQTKTDSAFVKWMSRWKKQLPPMTHKSNSVASLRSNIPRLQLFMWYFHNFCHVSIPKVTHNFLSVTEKSTAQHGALNLESERLLWFLWLNLSILLWQKTFPKFYVPGPTRPHIYDSSNASY